MNKIKKLQNKLQPCKEDNSVYCCPEINGPKKSFVGLIITGVIIVILLIIIAFMAMKK